MNDMPMWMDDDILHAWWADREGTVLAGEYPGDKSAAASTRRKLSLLIASGVGAIIDLTHDTDGLASYEEQMREVAAERGAQLRRIAHPILDVNVTTAEHYDRIVDDMEAELSAGRKVFIHCWGGVGRTGTVVGIWHVRRGLDPTAALERIADARRGTRKKDRVAPETPRQVEAIRAAHARYRAAARQGGPQS